MFSCYTFNKHKSIRKRKLKLDNIDVYEYKVIYAVYQDLTTIQNSRRNKELLLRSFDDQVGAGNCQYFLFLVQFKKKSVE